MNKLYEYIEKTNGNDQKRKRSGLKKNNYSNMQIEAKEEAKSENVSKKVKILLPSKMKFLYNLMITQ